MLVITVTKRTAAIIAVVLAALAVGGVAYAVNRGDSGSGGTVSAAAPDSSCTDTTTPGRTVEVTKTVTETVTVPTASSGRRAVLTDPGPSASPFERALYSTASQRFSYDTSTSTSALTITGSGGLDLAGAGTRLEMSSAGSNTEFLRIGDIIYVDLMGPRVPHSGANPPLRWLAFDTVANASQLGVRAVDALMTSMSPESTLEALVHPVDLVQLGNEILGTHYRATVARTTQSYLPMSDVFGPLGGSAATVDIWVDRSGVIDALSISSDEVTTRFVLRDFGGDIRVSAPEDAGDLASPAGTALFGSGFDLRQQPASVPSLTVAPTVELFDGIIWGTLGATSANDEAIRATFLGSSDGGKATIGNVRNGQAPADPQSFTFLPYASWLDGAPKGTQTFDLRVSESTAFDQYLRSIPLIGSIAGSVIDQLQATTDVPVGLASTIGASVRATIVVNVAGLAPGDTPVAFTYDVASFDGTPISTNFFPASGLTAGQVAPTVLEGADLGAAGVTDPYALHDSPSVVPGPGLLRAPTQVGITAMNVITWDARGSYDSGGVMQLDNVFFEARDVSALIDWAAQFTPAALNGANDPAIGMVGGSYGGGIQLTTAGVDPRIDAIVPAMTWNSLSHSLQRLVTLETSAAKEILSRLTSPKIHLADRVRAALETGIADGRLSQSAIEVLTSSDVVVTQLQAPTLLLQSTTDGLFPLEESTANAQTILNNPYGTPVKMAWFDSAAHDAGAEQTLLTYSVAWIQKYVVGVPIPDAFFPEFQWWDQAGTRWTSSLMPFDPVFLGGHEIVCTAASADITISPFDQTASIVSLSANLDAGTQIVGTPTVTFTYSGTGSAEAVYARVIDPATGRRLADATAIPVILDGGVHTVSVPLDPIVFTNGAEPGSLRIEIAGSDPRFANPRSGHISLSSIIGRSLAAP